MMEWHHVPLTLLLSAFVACGRNDDEDLIAVCAGRTPTIATGVYGCVTKSDDVGDTETAVLPNFDVQVFVTMPTPGDGLPSSAEDTTDEVGFYEIALAPGTYWLCTTFRRCVAVEVPPSPPVRRNYDFGLGYGW